ncbi:MAG: response regulator [Deltaproteobacteria bacterium]|nr:response regulator [Deltaproteobacteria bacterium]
MKQITLGKKIAFGFATMLCLTVIVGLTGYIAMDRVIEATYLYKRIHLILDNFSEAGNNVNICLLNNFEEGRTIQAEATREIYDLLDEALELSDEVIADTGAASEYGRLLVQAANEIKLFRESFDQFFNAEKNKSRIAAALSANNLPAAETLQQSGLACDNFILQNQLFLSAGAVYFERNTPQRRQAAAAALKTVKAALDPCLSAAENRSVPVPATEKIKSMAALYERELHAYNLEVDQQTRARQRMNNRKNDLEQLSTDLGEYTVDKFKTVQQRAVMIILGAVIVAFYVGVIFSVSSSRSIIKPVQSLNRIFKIVADGNLKVKIDLSRTDELGSLSKSFAAMRDAIQAKIEDLKGLNEKIKVQNQDLEAARNYLNNIFHSLPSMLISVNTDSVITKWNTAAEKQLGIPAADAVSQPLFAVVPVLKTYQSNLERTMALNKTDEFEYTTTLNDQIKTFMISISPLSHNSVNGAIVRLDDITELTLKNEQLRHSQKMETVRNVANGMANDFNNVLGGISGNLTILMHKLKNNTAIDNKELEYALTTMMESNIRATTMVKELHSLSRLHELTVSPVDLNEIIQNVRMICKNSIDKSIDLKFTQTNSGSMANADAHQLQQALLNICLNSAQAMTSMRKEHEHQGGTLSIALEQICGDHQFCETHAKAQAGTAYWKLTLRDTGIGMNAATVDKIFEPFFTSQDKQMHIGLGLSTVYSIIEDHKGFIDVYSEKDIGTSFHVFLPALTEPCSQATLETRAPAPPEAASPIQRGEGLILVVDDESIIRVVAKNILEECGYAVMLAEDGDEATTLFKQHHADIKAVLMDMAMPKKSGKEAFTEMQQVDEQVKVVVASGGRDDERVKTILRLGALAFIQKPFTFDNLAKTMHDLLES